MLAGLRNRTHAASPRRPSEPTADAGFSLIEMIVAITVIGVVMTALTSFFVTSLAATSRQRGTQVAIQLAGDGIERVRALKGSSVLAGRDHASSTRQWQDAVTGVLPYLTGMQQVWDPAAATDAGGSAALPTTPRSITINQVPYDVHWYVGRCWQPAAGGDCGTAQSAGYVGFLRVVSAVTWPENRCTDGTCSFVTSTVVSDASYEPVFNANSAAEAPKVDNPGEQFGEVSVPVSLQITGEDGAPPITWSAAGLPAGLTMNSSGLITGTPTVAEQPTVTVSSTDGFGLIGTAAFRWTVNALPKLTDPGDQVHGVKSAASLAMGVSGGTAPFTWAVTKPGPWGATGLPPGLSIAPATGVISGTPTTVGAAQQVTVTVTDRYGKAASTDFTWAITTPKLLTPGTQTSTAGSAATRVTLTATGGTAPYVFTATGLPPGLTITPAGVISGTPTRGTRFLVTLTVTDKAGVTDSVVIVWNVLGSASLLTITEPAGDLTGDLSDDVDEQVSVKVRATGGSGGYQWSATGLPPGTTINQTAGLIGGRPTEEGTYTVTLTVRDSGGRTAYLMFRWTIR